MPVDQTDIQFAYADPYHLAGQQVWVQAVGSEWPFRWVLVDVTAMDSLTEEYRLGLSSAQEGKS